jgi:hypothetical protein
MFEGRLCAGKLIPQKECVPPVSQLLARLDALYQVRPFANKLSPTNLGTTLIFKKTRNPGTNSPNLSSHAPPAPTCNF